VVARNGVVGVYKAVTRSSFEPRFTLDFEPLKPKKPEQG
jgi:hypothetical protein